MSAIISGDLDDEYIDLNINILNLDYRGYIDYSQISQINVHPSLIPKSTLYLSFNNINRLCIKNNLQLSNELYDEIKDKISCKITDIIDTALIIYDERNGKILNEEDIEHSIYIGQSDTCI